MFRIVLLNAIISTLLGYGAASVYLNRRPTWHDNRIDRRETSTSEESSTRSIIEDSPPLRDDAQRTEDSTIGRSTYSSNDEVQSENDEIEYSSTRFDEDQAEVDEPENDEDSLTYATPNINHEETDEPTNEDYNSLNDEDTSTYATTRFNSYEIGEPTTKDYDGAIIEQRVTYLFPNINHDEVEEPTTEDYNSPTYSTDEAVEEPTTRDYEDEGSIDDLSEATTEDSSTHSTDDAVGEPTTRNYDEESVDNLSSVAPSFDPEQKLSSGQLIGQRLFYAEITCIAAATICIPEFEDDLNTNASLRAIVVASANMWTKLSTMKRVNDIYLDASILPDALYRGYNVTHQTDVVERFPTNALSEFVLTRVDASMRADPALRETYLEEVAQIEQSALPKLERIDHVLPADSRLPWLVLNQYFLANGDGSLLSLARDTPGVDVSAFLEYYVTARGILSLSTRWPPAEPEMDRLQRAYDEALRYAVEMCPFFTDLRRLLTIDDVLALHNVLFSALAEAFARDVELDAELTKVKNELRGKLGTGVRAVA